MVRKNTAFDFPTWVNEARECSYPRSAKLQSKSTERWRIVTQELKNCETSQEWIRNYYPRIEKL